MTNPAIEQRIRENVEQVQHRIRDATAAAGRPEGAARLVAVTKYVDSETTQAVIHAGCRILGESRPQQLAEKVMAITDPDVAWHVIGPVQRNKIRRTLPLATMIESGESLKMLHAVDRIAGEEGLKARMLLEVNISGDATKHGFTPKQVEPALPEIATLMNVQICGIMGMSAWGSTPDEARRLFSSLREWRDRWARVAPESIQFDELSMGMSGDFEQAIAEGATLVRVGSALFEGVPR